MSLMDCYQTSRKTNSDGKRNRLNRPAPAIFRGGRGGGHMHVAISPVPT